MLYDPRREYRAANPLTTESLIAWLETMPAQETYDYTDCKGVCLYSQYMVAHGVPHERCFEGEENAKFGYHVYRHVAVQRPWTFGAALSRAQRAPAI